MAEETMKKAIHFFLFAATIFSWGIPNGSAQTRDQKVRSDRDQLIKDLSWYYDDLDKGITAAEKMNKPLMVVLRCIP